MAADLVDLDDSLAAGQEARRDGTGTSETKIQSTNRIADDCKGLAERADV